MGDKDGLVDGLEVGFMVDGNIVGVETVGKIVGDAVGCWVSSQHVKLHAAKTIGSPQKSAWNASTQTDLGSVSTNVLLE